MTASLTEEFFGFSHRPFRGTPDSQDYVPIDSIENEIERLIATVRQGDGVSVLTAPPGAGKSVVCDRLRHELAHDFKAAVLTSSGFATRRALLQAMLFALGQPYESFSEQELRLGVLNFARSVAAERNGIALIVDEAHLLNARLLEELRCLTNHSEGGRPLIRVILCGQLPLEDALVDPALQALNYRITCHSTLEPLSVQESAELIAGRLVHAGRTVGTIFSPAALETICRVSDGNPRCLVQLSDLSLALAAQRCEVPVSVEAVRLALQELKQLPLHWNESTVDQPPAEVTAPDETKEAADVSASWTDEEHDQILSTNTTDENRDTVLTDDSAAGWSSAVSTLEVGSVAEAADPCASESDVNATVPAVAQEVEETEPVETDVTENVASEDATPSGSAVEWSSFESEPQVEADVTRRDLPATETVATRAPEPAAHRNQSDFVELSVDDSYAALDNATAGAGGLRDAAELAAMLNSSVVDQPLRRRDESVGRQESVVPHPQDVDLPVGVRSLQEPSDDPAQRIDEVMAALSLAIDEPEEAAHDESDAEVEWQTAGDSDRFDRVEPYGEPIWDEVEPVIESAPTPREAALESPVTAVESRHGRPTDESAQSGPPDGAHCSDKRPYAHLFSRLRRRRA